jgi:hypothetical protein
VAVAAVVEVQTVGDVVGDTMHMKKSKAVGSLLRLANEVFERMTQDAEQKKQHPQGQGQEQGKVQGQEQAKADYQCEISSNSSKTISDYVQAKVKDC